MKPYQELTRRGQLGRLRQLSRKALESYGMVNSRLTFLHDQGNVVFRVDDPRCNDGKNQDSPYQRNRYLLRVLSINDLDTIRSELIWLSSLSAEGGFPVPEPIPTLSGELTLPVSIPGVPQPRVVTLMRWVKGKHVVGD